MDVKVKMSGWLRANLGDALTAEAELHAIEEAFANIFLQSKHRPDAAVFIRHENDGGVHCNIIAYFSPSVAELGRQFNANECIRPSSDGLSLLVGSPRAHEFVFIDR